MAITARSKRSDLTAALKKAQDGRLRRRLRRVVRHQGMVLHKSRRRNPEALDFDIYSLVDERGKVVAECEGLRDVVAVLDDIAQRDREGRPHIRYA